MSGSNLPPGISENMIPGNRPEDLAEEKFWAILIERANPLMKGPRSLPQGWYEEDSPVARLVAIVREMEYQRGFGDGRAEEQMAMEPDPDADYPCERCAGTGSLESDDSTDDRWWDCSTCDGTGRLPDRRRQRPMVKYDKQRAEAVEIDALADSED